MILPPERDNLEFGSHQIKISPKIAFCLVAGLDKSVNCSAVSDSATPWTVAHQAPLSMGFPRQEYRSG